MKASLSLLLAVSCNIAFSARVAAQNPYPTGCWDFTTETVYCNDVDSGRGSCHGSLIGVIFRPSTMTASFLDNSNRWFVLVVRLTVPELTLRLVQPAHPSQTTLPKSTTPGASEAGAEAAEIAAATVRPLCALLKSAI